MFNITFQQTIRICIVNSTEMSFLNSIRFPKLITNDIVLVYDPRREAIIQIDGFRSRLVGLPPQLITPIDAQMLESTIPNGLIALRATDHEGYVWLNEDQWASIRRAIVERNASLETVIDELEKAQKKLFGHLNDDDAILFDAVRLAVETFDPKNKRDVLSKLDSARELYSKAVDQRNFTFSDNQNIPDVTMRSAIKDALTSTEYGEPVSFLVDPIHTEMAKIYAKRWTEPDGVQQDFQNAPEGWARSSVDIPPRVLQDMVRLIDPDTGRELMVFMAHQEGAGAHDLAGADLIYDTVSHRSIIFVQYKRLSSVATLPPSAIDLQQLTVLLNLCSTHGCCHMDGVKYLEHTAIRVGDCPVYYKLLDHEPQIDSNSKRMVGRYIQACLLNQSLPQTQKLRKEIISRSIPHGTFYGLLGQTQIGSRASEYDRLRQRMIDFAKSKMVYAVEIQR